MSKVLVAGIGNVFFGDDGFGVEVAQRLAGTLPPDAKVEDYGIRAVHLAFELSQYEACIVADCMPRGGTPGTLYVVVPEIDGTRAKPPDAHGIDIASVLDTVQEISGTLPRIVIVGCEPETIEPGMQLSPSVAAAVPGAIALIRDLVDNQAWRTS
ncbi:MAG: hydrogenase maturation protease [Kofleriaceae bacterium]|nr:hydrogenase maturation protease [Kofleriaceae bacterium]